MHKTLLLIPLLLLGAVQPAPAETSTKTSLEAKLALENSMEKRVRMVLAEALGTEDVIVIISAELQEEKKRAAEILPGIPQKGRMGEPSLSSTLTMVKEISASLILDKSLPEEDVQLARKLAAGLLGLPADRQDLITVEKMDFRKTRPLKPSDFLAPPNLWSLVWIVVVALLAMFTVSSFLAPLSRSARTFVEAFSAKAAAPSESGASERSERRQEAEEKEEAAAKAKTEAVQAAQQIDGRKPPFWFLSPAHFSSLAFILKDRSAEDLTIVLNYAPQEISSKLAEALYPKSAEALASLPKVKLMPEARIRTLESEILSSLDYVVGGEEKAVSIISGLDEAVQDKALAAFTRFDPMMARKLKSNIIRLSNVADLEPAHAQALARRVTMRILAAALKGSPYAAPFISKLAGGMQERLKQELELTRDPAGEGYKSERSKVVEALRQLVKEGLVTLKAAGAAPARPGIASAARPAPAPGARPAPAPGTRPAPAPGARPAGAAAPKPAPAAPRPAPQPPKK